MSKITTTTGEEEPFIPYVKEEDYPKSLQHVLDPYVERMGFLPNAIKLYMHRPEIAETLFILNSRIMRDPSSTLDQNLKRRLGTLASKVNGCTYCTSHHCSILQAPADDESEGWGMSDGETREMLTGDVAGADEFERVCFEFVRAASADPGNVPDELRQRLKQHLTPNQIVELACLTGFWKFYNTVHDSLNIPLENHLQPYAAYADL